jgi:hypothetical protein
VLPGQCTAVRWDTACVEGVWLNGDGVAGQGAIEVCPGGPVEYNLHVETWQGPMDRSVFVQVPTVNFWADRTSLQQGECTTLHWDVEGAQAVYFDGEGVGGHDARERCPAETTAYRLRVDTACGSLEREVEVRVDIPLPLAPLLTLDVTGPSIGPIGTDPSGPRTCETGQVTVWAQITDDSGVARADVEYLFMPAGGVGGLASQPMRVDGNTFFTTITGLGVGELRINIRAWDAVGNETLSDKVTLVIALC